MFLLPKDIGKPKLVQRWQIICESLSDPSKITSLEDLYNAIISYNPRYKNKWKFHGLSKLLKEVS